MIQDGASNLSKRDLSFIQQTIVEQILVITKLRTVLIKWYRGFAQAYENVRYILQRDPVDL